MKILPLHLGGIAAQLFDLILKTDLSKFAAWNNVKHAETSLAFNALIYNFQLDTTRCSKTHALPGAQPI